MISDIAPAAFALALLGYASHSDASVFAPSGTKFAWDGTVIMQDGAVKYECQETVGAQTSTIGGLKITSVSFSGGQGCSSVKASGLPWTVSATSAASLTISKVLLVFPGGNCGPGGVPGNLGGGVLAFNAVNNLPGCSIAGGLRSTPTIKIVP